LQKSAATDWAVGPFVGGVTSELDDQIPASALVGGVAAELAAIGNAESGGSADGEVKAGIDHRRVVAQQRRRQAVVAIAAFGVEGSPSSPFVKIFRLPAW
jgi:hypothetical protein